MLLIPVISGQRRKRLFADDTAMKRLELISAEPTSSGVIIAKYRPAS